MGSVGVDAGRDRDNHYGSCVAGYGARHSGETCNGCLGIIKSSFAADYTDSTFTFTGNKFYKVKSTEVHGRLVYDLTNPEPAGRPQVCNHEWSKGGLTINEN